MIFRLCVMTLPENFTEYTRRLMGEELYGRFIVALDEEPPVSLRINPAKCNAAPVDAERVAWCPYGFYLHHRPAFTFDPLLHAGLYYVQEASSMFLHHVLSTLVKIKVRMLDLCAAPGGKSTTALGALPEGSVLVSNEPVRQRAQVLAENMEKWGNPNVIVTNNYPHDYATSGLSFDIVLCDVPCSGEGMFRKDVEAVKEWSVHNVEKCRQLQREIVADAWDCLEEEGLLIYSTCTYNSAENEENVAWICKELGAELLLACADGLYAGVNGSLLPEIASPVYRFIPGAVRGEGLFMAVMRKKGGRSASCKAKCKKADTKRNIDHSDWLQSPSLFDFFNTKDTLVAIPKQLTSIYNVAASKLHILHAGVTLGTVKGNDVVPAQSLALSTSLCRGAFPEVELSYDEAIRYLRKEPVLLPNSTPRGFVLVTYKGYPLGFEKNLGNRANNLYPQEWKIKSSHTPEERIEII